MSTKQLERATSKKKQKVRKVHHSNEEASNSKSTRKEHKKKKQSKKRLRIFGGRRIFPIWLRLIVVAILCALALTIGAMVGYGFLGDGAPTDVFKRDTWQHIVDIVTKEK